MISEITATISRMWIAALATWNNANPQIHAISSTMNKIMKIDTAHLQIWAARLVGAPRHFRGCTTSCAETLAVTASFRRSE